LAITATREHPTMATMSEKIKSAGGIPEITRGARTLGRAKRSQAIEKTQARLDNIEQHETRISLIRLEGLALLKIIRHCDQAVVDSDSIFGTLCGLLQGQTLEITDCFPVRADVGHDEDYQRDMLKTLGEFGVHNLDVGMYRCAFYNDFFGDSNIASEQYAWQSKFPSSVLLVYDPLTTRHGRLALKAFRLTQKVMKILSENDGGIVSADEIAKHKISTHDVFEEVPIVLKNHLLVQAFLFELKQKGTININGDSLAMHNQNDVVDMMVRMGDTVHKFKKEQDDYRKHLREMREWESDKQKFLNENNKRNVTPEQRTIEFEKRNKDRKPNPMNRLDSLLCTTLMDSLSEEMLESVHNDFLRIWVTKGI